MARRNAIDSPCSAPDLDWPAAGKPSGVRTRRVVAAKAEFVRTVDDMRLIILEKAEDHHCAPP